MNTVRRALDEEDAWTSTETLAKGAELRADLASAHQPAWSSLPVSNRRQLLTRQVLSPTG